MPDRAPFSSPLTTPTIYNQNSYYVLVTATMPHPGRPRIVPGIQESKTLALYRAGRALLAGRDFEAVSMAELAAAARLSVGAVYVRFADKTDFLIFLISESVLQAERLAGDALSQGNIKAIGPAARARRAVAVLTEQFAAAEFAGVLRAAVKLGLTEPRARAPLEAYRAGIIARFAPWIAGEGARTEGAVHAALQIILGALTDAALVPDGARTVSSGAFAAALTHLLESAASGAFKADAPKPGPEKSRATSSPDTPAPKPPARKSGPKPVSAPRRIRKI
jgi:AcrR family transcriptional regulator